MNIQLQVCGLVIVLFLLTLYKSHKTLGLTGESVFFRMLLITVACITLDALSIFAIRYRAAIPLWLMHTSCKAYLISLVWVGWTNFCYVMLDLSRSIFRHRRMVRLTFLLSLTESAVIAFLPISIFSSAASVYSYGPAVVMTYVFSIAYIVAILFVAICICKKKSSRRGMAVIMTTTLWLLASGIQFLRNELLLVGFSMAVGVMILYIVMENPDASLDRSLGCFNPYALHNYLSMRMEQKQPFSVMDVSITDVKSLEDRGILVKEATRQLIDDLQAGKSVKVFKNLGAGLIFVSDKPEQLKNIHKRLTRVLPKYGNISDSVLIFTVEDAQQFLSAEELVRFLTYVRSKSAGRLASTVHVSEDMIRNYRDIALMEGEINLALDEDRVEAFLQPICSTVDQRVVCAEALARIRKPDGGLLSPGQFIPVAEMTGQVNRIGERILEKVCAFLRDTDAIGMGLECIHVNLSTVQCDDTNTVAKLSRIVEQYGVEPSRIYFEITETAVSTAKDTLIENMNALISKGFRFALDDFGKGESNLMYIVEMPVELLKLDMDMSKAYFASDKARQVIGAIVDMAKRMHLPLVAEGIETQEEAAGITAEGIDFIQGYYYSRPLPMTEFSTYLMHSKNRAAESAQAYEITDADENPDDAPSRIRLYGNSILLVEDNELNLEIAQDILEDYGFSVDTAGDGTVAVEKVTNAAPGTYDLILMDIRMPLMDGYEATRRIRALPDPRIANIPVIALTSLDNAESRQAAIDAGMNEHLNKPIDMNKLKLLVDL